MKTTKEQAQEVAENQAAYHKVIQFVADDIWRKAGGDVRCLTVPEKGRR